MQPPAQVVTLFFCAAALIDLSMVQGKYDPPVLLTFACERGITGLVDGSPVVQLPPSTTSLARSSMVARSAYLDSTAALRCVPRCRHTANMRTISATSAISKHFRTPCARSSPAPLPSPSARTRSHFTASLPAVPLAQSFCHEPSNISTLA
jgi:hypothetical protein